MNTTTKKTPPTVDEVKAALAREGVNTDSQGGKSWSPASRLDVAHRIAMARGWNGRDGWTDPLPGKPRSGRNPGTREQGINQYVSVKAVTDILVTLADDGTVFAFPGRHELIRGKYGINPGSTYYLSEEALSVALAERRRVWVQNCESSALGLARELILHKHADEVEQTRAEILRGKLAAEPNWAALALKDADQ